MKNHIKNYIKIMGLAAVPFGTAQAEDVTTIRVKKIEGSCGASFTISEENEKGECLNSVNIFWGNKDEYPRPIFYPNGWLVTCWGDREHSFKYKGWDEAFIGNVKKWREFYGKSKCNYILKDALMAKIASQFASAARYSHERDELRSIVYRSFKSGEQPKFKNMLSCFMNCGFNDPVKYRKDLGERGKYVGCVGLRGCRFVLSRDAACFESLGSRYVLAILVEDYDTVCVFSDIPTAVFSDSPNVVAYIDNPFEVGGRDAAMYCGILYKNGCVNVPYTILRKPSANSAHRECIGESVRVCRSVQIQKKDANGRAYFELMKSDPVFQFTTSSKYWKFLTERTYKTPQEMGRIVKDGIEEAYKQWKKDEKARKELSGEHEYLCEKQRVLRDELKKQDRELSKVCDWADAHKFRNADIMDDGKVYVLERKWESIFREEEDWFKEGRATLGREAWEKEFEERWKELREMADKEKEIKKARAELLKKSDWIEAELMKLSEEEEKYKGSFYHHL